MRYRIDQQKGTATLGASRSPTPTSGLELLRLGPAPSESGLADLLGQAEPIGGYQPDGKRTFLLTFHSNFSYRAEPVPANALSAPDLRAGMRAMARAPLR